MPGTQDWCGYALNVGVVGAYLFTTSNCVLSGGNGLLRYDPSGNTWADLGSLAATYTEYGSAAAIGGKIYFTGGLEGTTQRTVESYDPATMIFRRLADTPTERTGATAVAAGGKIFVIGGALNQGQGPCTATVEIYDPVSNTWSTGPSLPQARWHMGAAELNGTIYVFGGHSDGSGPWCGGGPAEQVIFRLNYGTAGAVWY